MISNKLTIVIVSSIILVLASSMAFQPVLAILSARITSPAPGSIPLPSGRTSMTVHVDFQGTRDGGDQSPISGFKCSWDGSAYAQINCLTMTRETRTSTGWIMTGSAEKILGAGNHVFGVQVLNSLSTPTIRPATWPFTITAATPVIQPPIGMPIDPTVTPTAAVYKANSYDVAATTFARDITGRIIANNQYHFANGEITPYDKMYIVLEGLYGGRSDILQNVRTTFECQWDAGSGAGLAPCGRINFVQSVAPGSHSLFFRAINPSGVRGPETLFTWCVSTCVNYFDTRPISPQIDVRSFSGAPDEKITVEQAKQFPILNKTSGTSNQTIIPKDLKIFSGNQTSSTNNTNVTDLVHKTSK